VRTTGDPELLIEAVRREVHTLDATVPILQARTIEQQMDNNLLAERLIATLAGFFGLLAMMLAAVGLYGVMAQSVTGRTREMGIRMALGADRGSLLWMVLREALILVAIGTVIGVPAALAVTKYAASFLYGVTARDPWITAAAAVFLAAVAMFASYVPARRASRLDPNRALRYE
jgi:ABC-type antimicrobial peptide transport system permease subunit